MATLRTPKAVVCMLPLYSHMIKMFITLLHKNLLSAQLEEKNSCSYSRFFNEYLSINANHNSSSNTSEGVLKFFCM